MHSYMSWQFFFIFNKICFLLLFVYLFICINFIFHHILCDILLLNVIFLCMNICGCNMNVVSKNLAVHVSIEPSFLFILMPLITASLISHLLEIIKYFCNSLWVRFQKSDYLLVLQLEARLLKKPRGDLSALDFIAPPLTTYAADNAHTKIHHVIAYPQENEKTNMEELLQKRVGFVIYVILLYLLCR